MYTDQELQNICRDNPEKGAVLLMEQYEKLIWNVCARRLENPEDIKECVNETFADFFMSYEKFDEEKSNLKNYLCMIADRKAIDTYRKNLRRENFLSEEAEKIKEKQEFAKITSQEIERLEAAMEQLPPADKKILEMKYYDEMSYEEIGQKLGISVDGVRKRGQRGKKKLLYILLIGLLIATLIACAVVIYKKYYYSDTYGIIWTDETIYELVDNDAYIETEYFRYHVVKGIYQDGYLELKLDFEFLGEDEVITEENYKRIEEEISMMLGRKISLDYLQYVGHTHTKGRIYESFLSGSKNYSFGLYVRGEDVTYDRMEKGASFLTGNGKVYIYETMGKQEEDSIIIWLGYEGAREVKLEFAALAEQEYIESNENEQLPNGNNLTLGSALRNEEFTIINLHTQKDATLEYQLSPILINSYYGLGKREKGFAALMDAQGIVHDMIRAGANEVEEMRIFELHFPSMPEGEYTLSISSLCFIKEQTSQTITLELPTGDEQYKACDETVLFPDGSGFHIVGIERTEQTGQIVNANDDGSIASIEEVKNWVYTLECEVISMDEKLELCTALIKATTAGCLSNIDDRFHIEVSQKMGLESLEIYFENPVYVWEQELEWKVTLQGDN